MLQSNISASNNSTSADGIANSVVLGNDEHLTVQEEITADVGQPAVDIVGDRARLSVVESGSLSAPDAGNSAVLASGNDSTVLNTGLISGALNGVSSTGDRFTLVNDGTLASDSRAVDITDGNGVSFVNNGEVIGTGNQRNGTAYVDGTVDDLRIRNGSEGVIDAGKGNLGDAISVQVGASDDLSSDDINISNSGLLQGRGDGPAVFADGGRVGGNGSSGLRFFNGTGQAEARLSGSIRNSGTITSEVNVGFLGGLVVEDGVAFNGRIANTADGLISGPRNGLYIGNADHDLSISNAGRIESGSRAVNIDGDGVSLRNSGEIVGTGNQRNGTVYVDGTADDYSITNTSQGVIDAGEGNLGDAISIQVGAAGDPSSEDININNSGLLQGRGDGAAVFANGARVAGNGSSGLRFFNGSGLAEAALSGSIRNSGTITSEVNVGFLGGLVIEDGVAFEGRITNAAAGLISGPRNGLYIGNADHDLSISNAGRIESGSRAVNIDGDGVSLRNSGEIVGTGNQRNGTVYVDGTADDYSITNTSQGVIDAGEGNLGDAISIQVGAAGDPSSEDININNSGLLQGRGDGAEVFANGARVAGNGSSGLRFFNGSGLAEAALSGSIRNSGTITSEVNVGFLGGLVVEDGVAFEGRIANTSSGVISGPRNGLYIGNADHDLDIVNAGRIESGSRAVNIDGTGVRLRNSGTIIGTGDQRNGTVYADGTADDYSITNTRSGVIDAGEGNDGAGVSLQLGDVANDVVTASIRNDGLIRGRGQAAAGTNAAGDGVRLFTSVAEGGVTFDGNIGNTGRIIGSQDGISIQSGVTLAGRINNRGTIQGRVNAINAQDAAGGVTVDNRGKIQGDVVLSEFGDVFTSSISSFVNGTISGLGGDDLLEGGRTADTLIGGSGNDRLRGGLGRDSFVFESAGFGDDVIFDFQRGQDLLDVSGLSLGASDVKSIIGNAQQVGNAAQLSFGGGSVTLQGVQASALETSDFTFTA